MLLFEHLELSLVEDLLALLIYVKVKDGRHTLVNLVLSFSTCCASEEELLVGLQAADVACLVAFLVLLTQ